MATTADFYQQAFRARTACCRALLELTQQQQDCLASEDYTVLLELLVQKQQLLDEITTTGPGGPELWQDWRTEREFLPPSSRAACEATLDEAEELLKELLHLENASTCELMSRREDTRRALADLNQGSAAALEYQSPVRTAVSRRLDLDL